MSDGWRIPMPTVDGDDFGRIFLVPEHVHHWTMIAPDPKDVGTFQGAAIIDGLLREVTYVVRRMGIIMPGRTDVQYCKVLTLWSEPTMERAWRGIVKAWACGWMPETQEDCC